MTSLYGHVKENLYKITEVYTVVGFSNPTYVVAVSMEEAIAKVEGRLGDRFPNYNVDVASIERVAKSSDLIL